MKRHAFTLVEIMVVIFIMAILLTIAVPGWMNARDNSRQKTCLSNLREISDAKELWATANNANEGDPVNQSDLWPTYIKGNQFPSCPTGGTYNIQPVGTTPTCTISDGNWPHILMY